MEKRSFKGIAGEISLLGFGFMRLPLRSADVKDIDAEAAGRMVDRAIAAGVNYFDTAWVYHGEVSESFAGDALARYPRASYNLATKMPPWLLNSKEDMERIFSEQLRKCRVDYFDFYLIHNIGGDVYADMLKYDVYGFLQKKKEAGYIRHLGFSAHTTPEHVDEVAGKWQWDFAQIQLNYIDWEDTGAKKQYEILSGRGIPVVVMEPIRGGALANLGDGPGGILRRADPSASQASWAIRYAASLPGVLTVLSGMTQMEHVDDNLKTMTNFRPISEQERDVLAQAAASYRSAGVIPCTGCRYCMDCPAGVDIPRVFSVYNHYRKALASNPSNLRGAAIVLRNTYRSISEAEQADKCVACGKCVSLCPQGIEIPKIMKDIAEAYAQGVPA